jgi:Leu/Phe-tRNA-protein transferase
MDLCQVDIDELMERIINNEQYEIKYNAMFMALMTIKNQDTCKQAV